MNSKPPGVVSLMFQILYRKRLGPPEMYRSQEFANHLSTVIPSGKTVVDMGCSIGVLILALRGIGYKATGLDGTPGIGKLTEDVVEEIDLTGDCVRLWGEFDWGIFLEVGEHVPPPHEQQLINNVSQIPREGLIVSWATPGQQWKNQHVNCRSIEYVQQQFVDRGWGIDSELTKRVRQGKSIRKRIMTVFTK